MSSLFFIEFKSIYLSIVHLLTYLIFNLYEADIIYWGFICLLI